MFEAFDPADPRNGDPAWQFVRDIAAIGYLPGPVTWDLIHRKAVAIRNLAASEPAATKGLDVESLKK